VHIGVKLFNNLRSSPFSFLFGDVDILVIQSLLGHSSSLSTEPYIHPSMDKIREAMEKLPSVMYMKQLLKEGVLNLKVF